MNKSLSKILVCLSTVLIVATAANKGQISPKTLMKSVSKTSNHIAYSGAATYFVIVSEPDSALQTFNSTNYNDALNYYNNVALFDVVTNPDTTAAYGKILTNGGQTQLSESAQQPDGLTFDALMLKGVAVVYGQLLLKVSPNWIFSSADDNHLTSTASFSTQDEAVFAFQNDGSDYKVLF